MSILDVFENDAFNMFSLTAAIDKLPYKPGRIEQLGLFESKPSTNRHAVVEERQGRLSLLSTAARGSQNQTTQRSPTRKARAFMIPHVPQWDELLAEDLEGKRAFGSEDQEEIFSQVLADRLQTMKNNHEATWEYHRAGALHGIVLDNDGTTPIVNWFTEFGITQVSVNVDFTDSGNYDQANPTTDMKTLCGQIQRTMQVQLGNTPFTGIRAFCGGRFFDAFTHHATVRKAYERYQENQFARELQIMTGNGPPRPTGFMFGDIAWENYRGFVGTTNFFNPLEAIVFPEGTSDIFIEVPGPADFIETVNTRGQRYYAKQERIPFDKGVMLHTQSNVLFMCTRPGCLLKLTATGSGIPSDDDLIS